MKKRGRRGKGDPYSTETGGQKMIMEVGQRTRVAFETGHKEEGGLFSDGRKKKKAADKIFLA